MTITIAGREYTVSNAFSVLLDYVSEFGCSYLDDSENEQAAELAAARLVWCAIKGPKPDFLSFLAAAVEDPSFAVAARRVREHLFIRAPKQQRPESGGESSQSASVDELDVLQILLVAGVPVSLTEKLPIYALLGLVHRKAEAVSTGENHNKDYIVATPENVRDLRNMIRGR